MKKITAASAFRAFLGSMAYFFVFLSAVLVVSEMWLRWKPQKDNNYYLDVIKPRLWLAWSNTGNTNPLMPPFKVMANRDFNDAGRLQFVIRESALPKNSTLTATDFLRPSEEARETFYTAHINNLGFRDPTRSEEKPKDAIRIIALGAYQTFGHAVDDEDTFPRQLEKILNEQGGSKYEVWNGGRHAGSAIVGLARLKTEILRYKPDLLIWDYGDVDLIIQDDNNFPATLRFPDKGLYIPANWLLQHLKKWTSAKSYVLLRLGNFLAHRNTAKNQKAFIEIYEEMARITEKEHIRVILLRQTKTKLPAAFFIKFAEKHPHITFVNAPDSFRKYPPSQHLRAEFKAHPNWASEFEPDLLKSKRCQPPEYMTDFFLHQNKEGNEAIAKYLAEYIRGSNDQNPI